MKYITRNECSNDERCKSEILNNWMFYQANVIYQVVWLFVGNVEITK